MKPKARSGNSSMSNSTLPALVRVREAYPKSFPGDLASIKLIELHTAAGEDHLVERDLRLFLSRFPNHPYAAKAADLQAVVRTKFKSHPYSIAAIFPMSGKLAPFGAEVLNGIQLALERSKDGGETPSIGLIVKDTESDRAAFLDELSGVLSDDRPLAVIGPLLSKNLPVMAEMAERTRIPLITPSATAPNLRRFGSYVFSTALTYGHQAKRVADYAIREQQYKRVAILYPDTAYGRDLARLFAQEVRQQDGELIVSEPYKEGDSDFRAVIGKLKAEDLKKYGRGSASRQRSGQNRDQTGRQERQAPALLTGVRRRVHPWTFAGCGTAGSPIGVF
jgi:branched-chain amino acid transport system substrate-binding protein